MHLLQGSDTWGPWQFNALNFTLSHVNHRGYEINLQSCNTSAEVLDWLCHISRKAWCSAQDAGHLLTAFNDLLSPQKNLCSWGEDKKFDPTAHLKTLLAQSHKNQ